MHLAAAFGLVAIAAIISAATTPVVIRLCQQYKVLDTPGQRKIHRHSIPRLGGAAVFVAISLSMTAAVYGILGEYVGLPEDQLKLIPLIYGGLIGFFFIGFVDDVRSLPALPRLAAQVLVATLVVVLSQGAINIGSLFGQIILPGWLSLVLTVLWIVGVANMFNWIDGLDGLAAGIAAISAMAFLALAILKPGLPNAVLTSTISALVIGAVLGFLPYNFHPAKIFIGDGGAFSLGYLLSIISVTGLFKQAAVIGFCLPIAIMMLPLADTAFAIVRRLWRGQPVTQADNRHIHHRLMSLLSRRYRRLAENGKNGMTKELITSNAHRNTVLSLYCLTALFALLAVFVGVRT